ncbi:MAG: 50S ribosomal protein L15 [Candidatus Zixiibacteriota bacterium]|nr:MAG: 50S ribosomal protein L15 [candidate division Zixibacteria bacterium]
MNPLDLSRLQPAPRSRRKRKRIGRGPGSGIGKTSGRGHKGQRARSGGVSNIHTWSEGGQMPIYRRVPKRGFTNRFREEFQTVNIASLAKCQSGDVDPNTLKELGIIKSTRRPVKILGVGTLETALTVKASAFSKSAREKIEAAGGKTEVI